MPIYEFYCPDCHTIFNFLSRRINTEKRPPCPKCNRSALERKLSLFSISKGRNDNSAEGLPDFDEARMESVFKSLAGEMGSIDESNPKAMAQMMRKLYKVMDLKLGAGMEEAIGRMESGEDPDKIEAEMGTILEEEDPFLSLGKEGLKNAHRRFFPPHVDEALYEL